MGTLKTLIWTTAVVVLASACATGEEETTTSAAAPTTTTTAPTTTTTAAAAETTTTTTADATTTTEETGTTASAVIVIEPTTAIGVLQPYSTGGSDLFPPGSVEAHWYQWDGFYVVLYRGFDAQAGEEICAGNSIQPPAGPPFLFTTNSPYLGAADAICFGAPKITTPPFGVHACGPLLYYLTEIPIDEQGTLFGTLEIGTAAGFEGQTSEAASDRGVPEFEPGLPAYGLPPSDADELDIVPCAGL